MVISPTDIIFATAISYTGAVLVDLRISGVSSVAEVIRHLRSRLSAGQVFTKLRLRNYNTGCSAEQRFAQGPVLQPVARLIRG